MRFSKSVNRTSPDWLISTPIAHRGLHAPDVGAAENSLSAFEKALSKGLAIEFDVHLSSDKVPVIFHDDTLLRMTGDERKIADVSAEELATITLKDSNDQIPTLKTVLDLVGGKVPLVIELKKCPFGGKKLAQEVWSLLKSYKGFFSIQSFDPFILKWFFDHAPGVIRGQLSMHSPPPVIPLHRRFLMRNLMMNHISRPDYIGYDVENVHRWAVRRVTKGDIPLLAWTVSTESQLGHARKFADNIIFEHLPLEDVM
ncbi:MAG: hypothetical protein MI743_03205 [Sneathiellales bacterium]|nr:hypothetical protein [Sneathiellales bacterium]